MAHIIKQSLRQLSGISLGALLVLQAACANKHQFVLENELKTTKHTENLDTEVHHPDTKANEADAEKAGNEEEISAYEETPSKSYSGPMPLKSLLSVYELKIIGEEPNMQVEFIIRNRFEHETVTLQGVEAKCRFHNQKSANGSKTLEGSIAPQETKVFRIDLEGVSKQETQNLPCSVNIYAQDIETGERILKKWALDKRKKWKLAKNRHSEDFERKVQEVIKSQITNVQKTIFTKAQLEELRKTASEEAQKIKENEICDTYLKAVDALKRGKKNKDSRFIGGEIASPIVIQLDFSDNSRKKRRFFRIVSILNLFKK